MPLSDFQHVIVHVSMPVYELKALREGLGIYGVNTTGAEVVRRCLAGYLRILAERSRPRRPRRKGEARIHPPRREADPRWGAAERNTRDPIRVNPNA